jgi:hypothetical protein
MHLEPTTTNQCAHKDAAAPPIDAQHRELSGRAFVSYSSDAFRCVAQKEADVLTMPWGPRIDVVFHPKNAPGAVGGRVRVLGRVKGAEVELANAPINAADTPITLSAAFGCEAYAVRASLGSDPGPSAPRVETYVFARVYDGR